MVSTRNVINLLLRFFICWLIVFSVQLENHATPIYDTVKKSSPAQALQYLDSINELKQSKWWPNVPPQLLVENLKTFSIEPFAFYEGKNTNFCAYSALNYIPLTYDPLGFAKFMVTLYTNGQANFGKTAIKPSKAVRLEAGLLRYKGPLDINVAGQMWFLALADHYKGYLNIFNKRFQKGDENTFWASTNYAKFNRMLRTLFEGTVKARGADLIKPCVKDMPGYLQKQMEKGLVFLYLNNKKLYKKSHTKSLISTPTHYVLLTNITKMPDGTVEFVYWDYGMKTLQRLYPTFLKNIIYGITVWNPNKKNGPA